MTIQPTGSTQMTARPLRSRPPEVFTGPVDRVSVHPPSACVPSNGAAQLVAGLLSTNSGSGADFGITGGFVLNGTSFQSPHVGMTAGGVFPSRPPGV